MAAGHSVDAQLRAAQQRNQALQHQIDERKAEIAQAQSTQWLEEQARKLGYVLPGERVFVLATPGTALPPDGGIDLKSLPTFNAPPSSPGASPAPTPAPVIGPSPGGSPTPFVFTVPSPGGH